MSRRLLGLRNQSPRLAPFGVRPPQRRMGRPPDGWKQLDQTQGQHLLAHLDRGLLRFSDTVARGVSRREFLKRTGQAGFVVGVAASNILWHTDPAFALEPCNNPCGPSPPCADSKCQAFPNDFECDLSVSGVKRRVNPQTGVWEGYACGSATANNCWDEDCCARLGRIWRCCDCCVPGTGIPQCSTCSKHACVCRAPVFHPC
jgi:hypothetical protein